MDVQMKDSEVAGDSAHAKKDALTVGVVERARPSLDSLPDNVLHMIGMHIAPKHLKKLSMVNKRLHRAYADIHFKYKFYMKKFSCPMKDSLSLPGGGFYQRLKGKDREKIIALFENIGSMFTALTILSVQMKTFMNFDDLVLTKKDADLKLSRLKATISAMLEKVKHIPDAKFEIISEVQRAFMFGFNQATEGLLEGESEDRLLLFFSYLYGYEGICCSATSGQLSCVSFYLFDYLSTGDINNRVQQLAESIVQAYVSNAETSKRFTDAVLIIESSLPKGFRYYFWQSIWAKISGLIVKKLDSHRTAFLLAVCFVMKEMDARSIVYDYDGAEELIERHFAWFLEGKDFFDGLDPVLALGFSCGISPSFMAKMYWDKATSYTSMRQALKFCMASDLDPLQDVIDRVLMNKGSLDYIFSLVNAASYYIEDMEPVLAVLKNILFDYGLSETFYDFVRTGNIDFYAFVPKDIFDNDLGIVDTLDASEWAEAFERLRSKADDGKYASLLDLKVQKQAYEDSRDHDDSDSHGYGYGYYHGYYHDYGYYDSDYDYY
ncbi:hypothetical protein MP638_007298 [Amoeboaphelidium occidentale]|nr:hypothetical protein MP638_007298 [Amoeboaphelidium occidentale]